MIPTSFKLGDGRALGGAWLAVASMLAHGAAQAQAAEPPTLDERISAVVQPYSDAVAGAIFYSVPVGGTSFPLIVGWLIAAAVVFTLYFGFIQFRGFGHAIQVVRGRYSHPSMAGEVTPFQALTTAVSGTVGLGNIAGVAVAVGIGGAGATFWMILAGLLGMASKFTEVTLGVKYRNVHHAAGTGLRRAQCATSPKGWPSAACHGWASFWRRSLPSVAWEVPSAGATCSRPTRAFSRWWA